MRKQIFFAIGLLCFLSSFAQNYSTLAEQQARIQNIVKAYPQLATVSSMIKTNGGKDIWMITIGTGKTETKPAIAVVGGVEGNHLLGAELVIGFAENVLKASGTDSIKNLLQKTTYYLFPNMSPDASEQYFAKLKYERTGNATSTDDDRDGRLNEDPFDDLDGNGKITLMRIESPIGDYKLHPDDARALIKADPSKGEKGKYLLLSEGIDNDKDGLFNEDGEGGIAFNKNGTYKHKTFSPGAGDYPASEKETRALYDFLYDAFNVYAVISFGSNNNLSANDDKATSIVSDLYNKVSGLKDAPRTSVTGGDFLSWAYQHYVRYSFSTPGWWVPKSKPDTAKKEKAFTVEDPIANYLRWSAQQGITDVFTEWKTIVHPNFSDQKVEVGGVDPFVLINPPYKQVADLSKKHTEFLIKVAAFQPEIDLMNVKTESLANGLTRVSVDVVNKGALATHSKFADRNYFVKKIKVAVTVSDKQSLVGGKKILLLNNMEPSTKQSFSWIIKGKGKITIDAGCPTAGTKNIDISL
jgi:hypothetical protein